MGLLSTIGAASARAYGFTRSAIAAAVDAYFNRVTLLLPGNGTNGAQNNTFLDSSTNNFTITRNGNTTQGTFSPFSQTGWGNYFSSGNYISVASNAAFAYGTGAITIEFWHYSTTSPTSAVEVFVSNGSNNLNIQRSSGGFYNVYDGTDRVSTTTVTSNQWNHVAFVRQSGGQTNLYVNGTSVLSWTSSVNYGNDTFVIAGSGSFPFPGYISNMRVLKGTAQYTSSFTPPTSSLTAVTNTSLLTCQSNRFVDNSASPLTLTITGSPSVQAFSPFAPAAAYSAATHGGSGYFDGTGDYLTASNVTALNLYNTTNTVECWIYPNSFSTNLQIYGTDFDGTYYTVWSINSTTGYPLYQSRNGTVVTGSSGLRLNQWNHVVWGRSGTTVSIWVNGSRVANSTITTEDGWGTGLITIGRWNATDRMNGYLSGLRVVKGTDVYGVSNTTITVPTAPPTAITNTQLLLNFTNGGIIDATGKNDLETVGNAQISTTQSKFGGSSMYFDGTGDYAIVPASVLQNLGASDFTIEGWFYFTTTASAQNLLGTFAASPNRGWFFYFDTSLKMTFSYSTTGSNTTDAGFGYTPSTNTWVHMALVRSGADLKFYANGTQQGSTHNIGTSVIYANTQPLYVGERGSSTGGAFNGYIDDLRITRYARYTTTFTAPTAALPLQ
jgi:hypothetical protein